MRAAASVPLEDQIAYAEGAAARTRGYYMKAERENRCHPGTARVEIARAEAVVETLKALAQGDYGPGAPR